MSVITGPGFYRQRNGGKAEVFADRDGFWYGRHLEERDDQEWTGTCWTRKGRWLTDADDGHADCCPHDITGPWIEAPTPPSGYRLLPRDVKPWKGCQGVFGTCKSWDKIGSGYFDRKTADEWDRDSPSFAPHWFAEPIPQPAPKFKVGDRVRCVDGCGGKRTAVVTAVHDGSREPYKVEDGGWGAWRRECDLEHAPFRISEHGPGVYQTRDGREESVRGQFGAGWCRFDGDVGFQWYDDGRRAAYQDGPRDLVRYLRPLEEWKPTCELRLRTCTYEIGSLSRQSHRLEQKYTNGTDAEWRPVEIVTE